MNPNLVTIASYTPEEVLPFVTDERDADSDRMYGDYRVRMNSLRYRVFARSDGLKCAKCGITGTTFLLQRSLDHLPDRAHFNLFGTDPETGKMILLTKDHIIPSSKGGKDVLENLQTLCFGCNTRKGARMPGEPRDTRAFVARKRKQIIRQLIRAGSPELPADEWTVICEQVEVRAEDTGEIVAVPPSGWAFRIVDNPNGRGFRTTLVQAGLAPTPDVTSLEVT